jgi:serine/threonine protein kinase
MEFKILSQVGAGTRSPATVAYKARVRHSLTFVGIKKSPREGGGAAMDAVVALHRSLPPHASLLPLLHYYATPRHIYRVYEFAAGGSLRAVIASDGGLPEGSLRLFGADLTRLLAHAHASGVALCSLSPEAILLDEEGRLRLANLRGAVRTGGQYDARACALAYSAPELVLGQLGLPARGGGGEWDAQGVAALEAAVRRGGSLGAAPPAPAPGAPLPSPSSDLWTLGVLLCSGTGAGFLNGLLGTGGPPQMIAFALLEASKEGSRGTSACYSALEVPLRVALLALGPPQAALGAHEARAALAAVAAAGIAAFLAGNFLRAFADTRAILRVMLALTLLSGSMLVGALEVPAVAMAYGGGAAALAALLVALHRGAVG